GSPFAQYDRRQLLVRVAGWIADDGARIESQVDLPIRPDALVEFSDPSGFRLAALPPAIRQPQDGSGRDELVFVARDGGRVQFVGGQCVSFAPELLERLQDLIVG